MIVVVEKKFYKDALTMRRGERFKEYMEFPDMKEANAYKLAVNRSSFLPYRITAVRRA
jgi:hypothetical protein